MIAALARAAPAFAVTQQTTAAKSKAATPGASAPASAADGAAPAAPPPPIGPRGGSPSRSAPLDCAIEQTAILSMGQLVVLVNIGIPNDTKTPVATVLPLGLFLPACIKMQIDDGTSADWPIQTCELLVCFANAR